MFAFISECDSGGEGKGGGNGGNGGGRGGGGSGGRGGGDIRAELAGGCARGGTALA